MLHYSKSGVLAQLGEHLPYKQRVTGSSPVGPIFFLPIVRADMAQLAEQLICNQQVIGSSPIIGLYGWVPERPKGADCKSVVSDFGGSNPPPSTSRTSDPDNYIASRLALITRDGAVWKLVGLITRRS